MYMYICILGLTNLQPLGFHQMEYHPLWVYFHLHHDRL